MLRNWSLMGYFVSLSIQQLSHLKVNILFICCVLLKSCCFSWVKCFR
jgi:hypothetical protein